MKELSSLTESSDKVLLAFFALVLVCFSTDLRIGWNFRIGADPDFHLFEFCVILLLLSSFLLWPKLLMRFEIEFSRGELYYLLFLVNAILLAPFAYDALHSISRAKDFLVAGILYFLLTRSGLGEKSLRLLLGLTVLLGVLWSAVGILQWLGVQSKTLGALELIFLSTRAHGKTLVDISAREVVAANFAHGLYAFPQTFVYYLLFPFFISIGLARRKRFFFYAAIFIFIAILGTLSKTFIILFFTSVFFILLQRFTRNFILTLLIMVGTYSFVFIYLLLMGDTEFWVRAFATFVFRIDMWADVTKMFLDIPLILISGHGTEELYSQYSRYQYPNPHNIILYFLSEYGLFGATVFFLFLGSQLKRASFLLAYDFTDGGECKWLYIGLLFFLFMGVMDDIFVLNQFASVFMLYLGILVRALDLRKVADTLPAGEKVVEIG